jgi:M6 family metalloprotease-like protein
MSGGMYKFVGDCYDYHVPSNYVFPPFSDTFINDVLTSMETIINYGEYDNWTCQAYSHQNNPDCQVDWVFVILRFPLQRYFSQQWPTATGYTPIFSASNPYHSSDLNNENSAVSVSMGSVQGGASNKSEEYMAGVCLHELAHNLFGPVFNGDHNGRIVNLGILNGNQVGYTYQLSGLCAWEKEVLNWLDYITVSSDQVIVLHDYMTTNEAIKIPTTDQNKFYVIENRQSQHVNDRAYAKGIYIYRCLYDQPTTTYESLSNNELFNPINFANNEGYDGMVNVLTAEGRWNFNNNLEPTLYTISSAESLRIWKTDPNPLGYDERDLFGRFHIGNSTIWKRYYCLNDRGQGGTLHWYNDSPADACETLGDAFGDSKDAFSLDYNKVFSIWSNPGTNQIWAPSNFSVEVIPLEPQDPRDGRVRLRVNFSQPQIASLPRPMGLDGSTSNGISFALHWHRPNTELQPGFDSYQLYHRRSSVADWNLIATNTDGGPEPTINLSIPYNGNPNTYCLSKRNYFKVRAVKSSSGGESNYSDELKLIHNEYIIQNYTLPSGKSLIIGDSLVVHISAALNLENDTMLQIGRGSQLIVDPNATITLGDNCLVKGTNLSIGDDIGSKLIVNGSITCGSNVGFSSDGDPWDGLFLDTVNQVSLNGVSFNKADLTTYTNTEIQYSDFTDCLVKQNGKDVIIANTTFNNAGVKSFDKLEDSTINISSCTFDGNNSEDAIELSSLSKYFLTDNQVSNYKTAVVIYESKNGLIEQNHLLGNNIGIQLYHAMADIYNANVIENNDIGIVALRNSLWSLQGTKESPYQKVINNTSCQILFTYDSAPEYMEFNQIFSITNSDKPFVICESVPADPKKILIANNYFGDEFDPDVNLSPTEIFIYEPLWEPKPEALNISIVPPPYKTVKTFERTGDYLSAKSLIYQFIAAVPDTSILYDESAKKLLSLEKVTTDNYTQLQTYYNNQSTIYPPSVYLLQYLSNYCKIESNDLQSAILWLEAQIESPVSSIDSLFAAIDIGYIYLLSEDNKASVQGKMSWLKPVSQSSYETARNNAIHGLIYGQDGNAPYTDDNSIPTIVLGKNYPNPFNPSTTLSFSIKSATHCKLRIYNIENMTAGKHSVYWNGTDDNGRAVSSGVYLYKLMTPQKTMSAKMLMLK